MSQLVSLTDRAGFALQRYDELGNTVLSKSQLCVLWHTLARREAGKNGTSRGQAQAYCKACGRSVSLKYGTAYFRLDSEPALFELAIRALAEGNSMRGTARIVQVDKDTVCDWLNRAAHHRRLVMLYHWQNLHITECQLDELWSFVHTKEQNLATAKRCCETYGDVWVWIAYARLCCLTLAFVVGERTQAQANQLVGRVAQVTDETIPFFTSDQLTAYQTALLQVYGEWYQPERRGTRGCLPLPRRRPLPDLRYAQVVKRREKGRVVEVTGKVVFGTSEHIDCCLAASPTSHTINTSLVERDNLTLRQANRRLTRKTNGFSKELHWLEKQF
jgi:IS1 family transposase